MTVSSPILRSWKAARVLVGATLVLALTACGGGGGSGSGGGHTAKASAPTPSISSISPTEVTSGSPDITLTVKGSNFTSSSYILWDGTSISTTFVNQSTLRATISANFLTSGKKISVSVMTPTPGGGTSGSIQFTIKQGRLLLSSVSPESVPLNGPSFELTIRGDGFTEQSHTYWNGQELDAQFISGTEIHATVPASLLTTPGSGAIGVTLYQAHTNRLAVAVGYTTARYKQDANHLAWDPAHKKLYVSIPADAATNTDSVATIDPATGKVTPILRHMHGPDSLALAGDDSYLYVGTDLDGAIKRFTLPGLTQDVNIDLGNVSGGSYQIAGPMAVAPGQPRTFIVSLLMPDYQYPYTPGGVIFDDGTARSLTEPGSYKAFEADSFQWNADGTKLFGNAGQFGLDFETFTLSGSVLTQTGYYTRLFSKEIKTGAGIHYDADRDVIVEDNGVVVDPFGNVVADFNMPTGNYAPGVVDSATNRAFFIGDVFNENGELDIWKFNLTTHELLGRAVIAVPNGYVGTNGLVWVNHDTLALVVTITEYGIDQISHKEIYFLSGPFAQP